MHDNINWSPVTSSFTPDNAGMALCRKDTVTKASSCMASYSAELVAGLVLQGLGIEQPAQTAKVIPIAQERAAA